MAYIRKISQQFVENLLSGELKELLAIVKSDDDLQLEIRKGYINIYYLGGNLLKVTPKAFKFDAKYCLDWKDTQTVETIKTNNSWIKNIKVLKDIMKKWHTKYNKLERKVQQNFCKENATETSPYFIIDMEYQVGNIGRVDMLGLRQCDTGIKIVLIELKQGHNSIAGNAVKHYHDFAKLVKEYPNDIRETVKNIYANKVALGLVTRHFDLSQPMDFEILFVLYDYNDNSIQLERALTEARFNYIKIPKGTFVI